MWSRSAAAPDGIPGLKFMVEKLMTRSRTSPKVEYKVTQPQQLTAAVTPEEAQNKKVGWNLADGSMAALSEEGLVTVKGDAKWIQDLEAVDAANVAKNRYALSTASGTRETIVTATTEDGQKTASSKIVVEFKTTDQTTKPGSSSSGCSGGGGSSRRGGSSSRSSSGSVSGPGKESGEWIQDTVGWWYKNQDGTYPKSCWQQLSYNGTTEWYHFDEKGYMQTGWLKLGKSWYYLKSSGPMAEGWQKVGGAWYYLNPGSGAMATGWKQVGGTWYYLKGSGAMATGWQKVGGSWYYLKGSGAMAVGWQKIGGTWYYLKDSGTMATGWRQIDGHWYFLSGSGAMAKNKWIGDYYLTGSGAMATNTWIGKYHVNAAGKWDQTR